MLKNNIKYYRKVEKNIDVIFEDKTISYKELNSNISLDFSQANIQNKIIDDKNNFGTQNYSGKLKKMEVDEKPTKKINAWK